MTLKSDDLALGGEKDQAVADILIPDLLRHCKNHFIMMQVVGAMLETTCFTEGQFLAISELNLDIIHGISNRTLD
eukprot:CAMPEP_0197679596 /NCGR_PEP_ID=MMETSP1338-20131121/91936_1 /TAXON_ID=43686 ORGANISM="Pelagodinium beii, Strain RCC1491" /NCGR_SAMPLE_ID=MMETSP1338 /ASSEMBLY_ACC=CAM_ASM_000754 /LENGTH=74 /DNA_ID=CAMNT_0043260667 /DNA_START=63 /DNA_END=284 /DNA_ORIENTATION=+